MIECDKCKYPNEDINNKCVNCGLLINVSFHDQPKETLFQRLHNDNCISEKDWTILLFLLLIPLFNLYIIIRFGFITKKESTIRGFFRSIATVFVGIITYIFMSNLMDYFFNYII